MATYKPADSTALTRGWGEGWHSAYEFEFPPQVWQTWYKKHGKGFGYFDFLTIAGNIVSIKGNTVRTFEDGTDIRPIKLKSNTGISAVGAGNQITFRLDASEYDSGKTYLRVGETIIIPARYADGSNVPLEYRVDSIGADENADSKASALLSTSNIVGGGVPAGTYLMVGATRYARGQGQPRGRSVGGYYRDFETGISKETFEINGGEIAQESYRALLRNGEPGLFSRALLKAEFGLNNQLNNAIFLSDPNTKNLTGADKHSENNKIRSTKGLWNWADELAMPLDWAIKFMVSDLETAQELLRSQGVVDLEVVFAMGPRLARNVENMGLEFVKDYSSSDLKKLDEVGFSMKTFTKLGITFHMKEFVSFSNPNTFGVDADYFGNAGLIIPMSEVTVKSDDFIGGEGGKISIPNLALGYLNNNGENRTRIVQFVAGVNGIGLPATNEYDSVEGYLLTEYMVVANQVNQWIRVLKSGTY